MGLKLQPDPCPPASAGTATDASIAAAMPAFSVLNMHLSQIDLRPILKSCGLAKLVLRGQHPRTG
jgi:hypothetical protein